jgi:Molybdopterin oxidoreductase Fe4S4 domain/Molybdopterin oxidoreductase
MGIAGAGNSGTVLASLFTPLLAEVLGWHEVFGLALIPVVLTLAVYLALAKDSPEQPVPKPWGAYLAVLQEADTWWFNALYSVTFGGFVGLASFLAIFFYDQYGMSSAVRAANEWGRTQCLYCGVGCGLLVQIQSGQVVRVKGDPHHPTNFGDVCTKAIMLPRSLHTNDRLLYPHLRMRRDHALTREPWSLALKTIVRSFRSIITQYGPNAISLYGSGQLLTED